MVEPVLSGLVVGGFARCEVIEHDRSSDGEPTVGGVDGRVIRGLLTFASAVEDEEIEGPKRL